MTSQEASDRPRYNTEIGRRRIHAITRTTGGRALRPPAGAGPPPPAPGRPAGSAPARCPALDRLGRPHHRPPATGARRREPGRGPGTGTEPACAGRAERPVDPATATTRQATVGDGNAVRDNDNGANYRLARGGSRAEDRTAAADPTHPCAFAGAAPPPEWTAARRSHPARRGADGPHLG
ncbi:carbohydrate binding domain-containing protein [Streptomyces sp. NPDC004009]